MKISYNTKLIYFTLCLIILTILTFTLFSPNEFESTKVFSECKFNKLQFENNFTSNSNILTYNHENVYIYPEIENLKCLGKVTNYEVTNNEYKISHAVNPLIRVLFYGTLASLLLFLIILIDLKKLNINSMPYTLIAFLGYLIFVFEYYFFYSLYGGIVFFTLNFVFFELGKIFLYYEKTKTSVPFFSVLLIPLFYIFHFILLNHKIPNNLLFLILLVLIANIIFLKSNKDLKIFNIGSAILSSFLLNFGSFTKPINDFHGFRQSQTAIAARVMNEDGISILTPGPYFGVDAKVPFEFPFLQILSALFQKSGVKEVLTLRPISWLVFIIFLVIFYNYLYEYHGSKIANYSIVFLIFHPLIYRYSNAFLIEFIPHIFGILSIKFFKKRRNLISALFLSVSLLSKVTSGFVYVLFLATLFIRRREFKIKEIINISLILLLPNLAWIYLRESTINSNPQTYWLNSKNLRDWNFATREQFIDAEHWIGIFYELLSNTWNKNMFSILGILFLLLVVSNNKYSLIVFVPIVIFSNLYFVHDYYFLAILPMLIFFIVEFLFKNVPSENILFIVFVLLISFISYGQKNNQIAQKVYVEPYQQHLSKILMSYEQNNVYLASGQGWDPTFFFESNKKGIMWAPQFTKRGKSFIGNEISKNKIDLFIARKNYLNKHHLAQYIDYQLSLSEIIKIEFKEDSLYLSSAKNLENSYSYISKKTFNSSSYTSCFVEPVDGYDIEFYNEVKDYIENNYNIKFITINEDKSYMLNQECNT